MGKFENRKVPTHHNTGPTYRRKILIGTLRENSKSQYRENKETRYLQILGVKTRILGGGILYGLDSTCVG